MTKTYILGISAFYHDSAAALICDGEIIAAAQEERFTRKKHDAEFPKNAIEYCLQEAGISAKDLAHVVFYDKPFLKFERILETYMQYAPFGITSFLTSVPVWIKHKIWIKSIIAKQIPGFAGEILFTGHHQSHLASAFYPSPFQEAAIVTVDGVGEWATTSIAHGKQNAFTILEELRFPHSLGMLYSAITYFAGFKVNSAEYKVMGLAPYGKPTYVQAILDNLIDIKEDGSFQLNMEYFNFPVGLTMTNEKFGKLFDGPPRKEESALTQREMDLACSLQQVLEMVMIKIAKHAKKVTGSGNLCLAGGVALNCVANSKILKEGIFDNIWIQPAAGDAGGALGAALAVWHSYLAKPRAADGKHDTLKGSLLGPAYRDSAIADFLKEHNIPYAILGEAEMIRETAQLLASEKVVGWFQGRMEFGPRALGARSILADPRSINMQKVMNLKIKFRESFRPFAPSVLREKAQEYFDIDRESPYMLLTADVKHEHRKKLSEDEEKLFGIDRLNGVRSSIPAVTHVDYSARLQTVDKQVNPKYWELINAFFEATGCPILVNTSFNVRGEPIVCSPEDAYRCFMGTGMDHLVMGNFLLDKADQPPTKEGAAWQARFVLD